MSEEKKPEAITETTTARQASDMMNLQEAAEKQFFTYINEGNSYHTAHVLQKIIKSKPDNIKYVYLVIASVEPDIATRLLTEFPDDMKAKIMSEMISLIQYTKKEIESFDKILRRLLTEQFGGKYVLSKILEQIDIDQKIDLASTFQKKYPDNAALFRSIMLLFEDLFNVNDKDFNRIFSDIPSEVLSIAFCNQPEERIEKLYNVLPRGVRNIVQQGIELGGKKYSKSEINKAQKYIIEFSKNLERDGFIEPILKEETASTKDSSKETTKEG